MPVYLAFANIYDNYSPTLPANPTLSSAAARRKRSQVVAYYLLEQLCKKLNKPTALLQQIEKQQNGRPFIPHTDIDFNISHSGDWVAVILADKVTTQNCVAIDIEHPLKQRNYTKLLTHFAPKMELEWFHTQQKQELAFYQSWCMREAVLKAQGVGIVALSKVTIDFPQYKIISPVTPKGSLFFCAQLPFYLAFFIAGSLTSINKKAYQCLHWRNNQLQFSDIDCHSYQVLNS